MLKFKNCSKTSFKISEIYQNFIFFFLAIGCGGVHRHVHPGLHGAVHRRDGRAARRRRDPRRRGGVGGAGRRRRRPLRGAHLGLPPQPGGEPRHGRARPPPAGPPPPLRGGADGGLPRRRVPRQGRVLPARPAVMATVPAAGVGAGEAFVVEVALTFVLVFVITAVATDPSSASAQSLIFFIFYRAIEENFGRIISNLEIFGIYSI